MDSKKQRDFCGNNFNQEEKLEHLLSYYKELYFKEYKRYTAIKGQYEKISAEYKEVSKERDIIKYSTVWKLSEPLRNIMDLFHKFCKKGRKESFRNFFRDLKKEKKKEETEVFQEEELKIPLPKEEELEEQRKKIWDEDITFSIAVPLYNTPAEFLKEMIESVLAQTYKDWELCMADGSDSEHEEVEKICKEYALRDGRR